MHASIPMTRDVFVVLPETPLSTAWAIMQRERIRHLPVVQAGQLLGILSDRDVLLRASIAPDGQVKVDDRVVATAMTTAPFVCGETTEIDELVQLMTEKKIDAIPVVSSTDRLVGLVTSTDLLLLLLEREGDHTIPFDFQIHEAKVPAV